MVLPLCLYFLSGMESVAAGDRALFLDGTNDYAIVPTNPSLDLGMGATQSFTIEFSFYLGRTNLDGYFPLLFREHSYELGVVFRTNYPSAALQFRLMTTSNDFSNVGASGSILKPGRHHVAAVYRNTPTQDVRMVFLDGLAVSRWAFDNLVDGIPPSSAPLQIGGVGGNYSFPGWIDEVRLSDCIRYTNDNAPGFNVPYRIPKSPFTSDSNTVALWHFDEPPGATTFLDASGHGNDLTGRNGATTQLLPEVEQAGLLDLGFYPGLGIASPAPREIFAVGIQTNGQILVAGSFTFFDGSPRTNIARLNSDGSLDPLFSPQITTSLGEPQINTMAVQTNGQILIGGRFERINGVGRTNFARLNSDGSLDNAFNPPFSYNFGINDLAILHDGRIVIAGTFGFGTFPPDTRAGLARLNPNGTVDLSFDAGSIQGFVDHLLVQAGGQVLISGFFGGVNGTTRDGFARLGTNGVLDPTFAPFFSGQGFNSPDSMALQSDGKILIAGMFTSVNGVHRPGTARLNANGALDFTFDLTNAWPSFYTNGGTLSFVTVQADGKIILGGVLNPQPGVGEPRLIRLMPDGSVDSTFEPAEFYRSKFTVNDSAFLCANSLLIVGDFEDVNGYSRSGIALLQGDPVLPPWFLSITQLPAGVIRLDVTNPAALPLVLQSTTNLVAASWQTIATNSLATNQWQFFHTNVYPAANRYYRTVLITP